MLLDRRLKKREMFRTIAEYKVLKSPKDAVKFKPPKDSVKAHLLDISVGGCALDSPYAVPIGTKIAVKIDPLAFALEVSEKRKKPLEMTGRITSCVKRSSEHSRIGILFTAINKKDILLIKRFIFVKERRKFQRWDMTSA